MKKLLSVLAAVGMTATASTAVVACTSTVKVKDNAAVKEYKNIKLTDGKKATDLTAADFTVIAKVDDKDFSSAVTLSFAAGTKDNTVTIKATVDATKVPATDKKQTLKVEIKSNADGDKILKKSFDEKFNVKIDKASSKDLTVKDTLATTAATDKADEGAVAKIAITIPAGGVVSDGFTEDEKSTVTLTPEGKDAVVYGTDFTIKETDAKGADQPATDDGTFTATNLVVTFVTKPTAATYKLVVKGNSCLADTTVTITITGFAA